MPNYDDNEFKEIIESETGSGETGSAGNDRQHGNDATDAKCYICGRPESVTGPLMRIPNNICICNDCMQKTFDAMSSGGWNMNDMMNMNMGKMDIRYLINYLTMMNTNSYMNVTIMVT